MPDSVSSQELKLLFSARGPRQFGDLRPAEAKLVVERTAKGGLHVIVSQALASALLNGFNLNLPDSVMNYMITNKTHNYYFSQWRNLTAWPPQRAPMAPRPCSRSNTTAPQ